MYIKNMKYNLIIAFMAFFALAACNEGGSSSGEVTLANEQDSLSYFIGISYGANLTTAGVDEFNFEAMRKGMEDGFTDSPAIDQNMVRAYIMGYFDKKDKKDASVNEEENLAWLEENKSNEGVIVAAEGYQYSVITEGTGEKPAEEDTVTVHYTGKLIDGTTFDSSIERGIPASFPVNKVIQGWTMALQQMSVGSKWMIYIPPALAYGPTRGPGGDLPLNSTLIFEVELLSITKAL